MQTSKIPLELFSFIYIGTSNIQDFLSIRFISKQINSYLFNIDAEMIVSYLTSYDHPKNQSEGIILNTFLFIASNWEDKHSKDELDKALFLLQKDFKGNASDSIKSINRFCGTSIRSAGESFFHVLRSIRKADSTSLPGRARYAKRRSNIVLSEFRINVIKCLEIIEINFKVNEINTELNQKSTDCTRDNEEFMDYITDCVQTITNISRHLVEEDNEDLFLEAFKRLDTKNVNKIIRWVSDSYSEYSGDDSDNESYYPTNLFQIFCITCKELVSVKYLKLITDYLIKSNKVKQSSDFLSFMKELKKMILHELKEREYDEVTDEENIPYIEFLNEIERKISNL